MAIGLTPAAAQEIERISRPRLILGRRIAEIWSLDSLRPFLLARISASPNRNAVGWIQAMIETSDSEVRKIVHEVFASYVGREVGDHETFQKGGMKLLSDDLTEIALEIERKLKIRIDRKLYLHIYCIADYLELLRAHRR